MERSKILLPLLFLLPCLVGLTFFVSDLETKTLSAGQSYELAINNGSKRVDVQAGLQASSSATTSALWFIGDVMLSRQVGAMAAANGYDYPWRGVTELFGDDYVLANFESCFSATKTFTRDHSMRFPVNPVMVDWMHTVGITHVSQANNHGLDCGQSDYEFSRELFTKNDITPIGHPTRMGSSSVTYVDIGDYRLGLLALHTLFLPPTPEQLSSLVNEMAGNSDLQVVFIHWGDEYQLSAVAAQRMLAEQLADMGIDLVVGHHPHVVQDIDRIGNTLIVYSLGNFIFDQYFSVPVQEGLAVKLLTSPELAMELVPVTTRGTPTQPMVMTGQQKETFLKALADRSYDGLYDEILRGRIDLAFLATSSKNSIISAPKL